MVGKDEHGKQSEQIVSMQKSEYLVFLMELALGGITLINLQLRTRQQVGQYKIEV